MSIKIMSYVWLTKLPSSQKLLLLYYADIAHDDGSRIWPSIETIAQATSFSKRTIQRLHKSLISKEYIFQEGWSKYHTKYLKICLDTLISNSNCKEKFYDNKKAKIRQNDMDGVSNNTFRGVKMTPKPLVTIKEPLYVSKNQKKSSTKNKSGYEVQTNTSITQMFLESQNGGIEHEN